MLKKQIKPIKSNKKVLVYSAAREIYVKINLHYDTSPARRLRNYTRLFKIPKIR